MWNGSIRHQAFICRLCTMLSHWTVFFLVYQKKNKYMHLWQIIMETVKKWRCGKPVSVLDSLFSIAGQSSWWCPLICSLKTTFLVLLLQCFFSPTELKFAADLPGNCLETIGCCWRTYLMYPFRGLFGGPLGWELRYFTVLMCAAGRTQVHLQKTHTSQIVLSAKHTHKCVVWKMEQWKIKRQLNHRYVRTF